MTATVRHREPSTAKNSAAKMRVKSTEDGLHLSGSILWLDSHQSGELSFLSSALSPMTTRVPQVITTEETVKILDIYKKKPNALICQYNRPFSIGRLKIELLPSGSVLGGASLYIETDQGRLLYAPSLQTHKISTVRQLQLKRANTLVVGAYHADPQTSLPSRRKERERLLTAVERFYNDKLSPVILCHPIGPTQEVIKLLTDNGIPVSTHYQIFRINKIYEAYGSRLGNFTIFSKRRTKHKAIVLPYPTTQAQFLRAEYPDGPIVTIEETLTPNPLTSRHREIANSFFMSTTADGKDLKEVISAVDPKELHIFGPFAKTYADAFSGICSVVKPLYSNDEPTLF